MSNETIRLLLFYQYTISYFERSDRKLYLFNVKIVHLLYADDTVLLSESASDLQHALDVFYDVCDVWKLHVNTTKDFCNLYLTLNQALPTL